MSYLTFAFFGLLLVLNAAAQTYSYDLGGRLTGADYANGTQVKYTYDAAGNIPNISPSSVQTTNPPVITITTPLSGSSTANSPLAVIGTASGANQVIFVLFQVKLHKLLF